MHSRVTKVSKRIGLILLIGCVSFAGSARADDKIMTIEPGDPRITDDITKPRTMRWSVTGITPGKPPQPRGVWLDKHENIEIGGRKLRRHQSDVVWAAGRPRRDIIFWDQETMAVVTTELENYNAKGGWSYFIYDKNKVNLVFRSEPFGEAKSYVVDLERPVFDIGHAFVLANMLKLQPSDAVRFPYHDRRSNEAKWLTVEAIGHEKISTPKYGAADTLVLQSNLGWLYYTVDEPPYLYRLEIPSADGSLNRWDLLEYFVDE